MKKTVYRLITLACLLLSFQQSHAFKSNEVYEIRTYYFDTKLQEDRLDQYLLQALLPGLHRMNIKKVGVFKPIANDTSAVKRIIVLIPFDDIKQFLKMEEKLEKDQAYLASGKDYLLAVYTDPPYKRIEKVLLQAFPKMPVSKKPALKSQVADRVYELRSYESATEKIYQNKVQMFNEGGEVALFERLGFNAVFYGEVLVGSRTPNLMYMTSFENMEERNAHWKTFSADAEWKKLSGLPQYQKNVSKSDIILMRSTSYSDL